MMRLSVSKGMPETFDEAGYEALEYWEVPSQSAAAKRNDAKPTQTPPMTVIINGEEHQRTIKGYVDGLPYPETFDDEFCHRVMSSVVPTIVKSK